MLKEGFIICDNETKEQILKNQKDFKNYIFLTYQELKNKLTFTVDKKAIFKIMDHYKVSYFMAKEYIQAINLIENKTYNIPKLDSLVSMRNYLIEEGLLTIDKLFVNRLKQYPVTFINQTKNKRLERLTTELVKYTNVYYVDGKKTEYNHSVYRFNNSYDECIHVFNEITKLIKYGVSLNDIYIMNSDESYEYILKRLAINYNIPVEFKADKNILTCDFANEVLFNLDKYDSFHELMLNINSQSVFYNKFIDIINEYKLYKHKPNKVREFIINKFKNMSYDNVRYKESIKIKDIINPKDSDYVFFLGLNLGSAPRIYKNDKYLDDKELSILGLDASYDKNLEEKNKLINFIKTTKNLYLSYKDSDSSNDYEKSNIISELSLEVLEKDIELGVNDKEDNIRLSLAYDGYIKYKNKSELLNYDLKHLRYKNYDNKYKQINKELLEERFNEKPLKMAYSNMKTYYACPFYYYADRILYLNEFKPNMAARLGSYSHKVLEESYSDGFDFNISVENAKVEYATDSKDLFYFTKMEETLRNLIEFNRIHESKSSLNNVVMEPHIVLDGDGYMFEGYVDKLLYQIIDNEVYAVIIDYKTGKDIISLDNVEDGFNLQLPIYMLLLSEYEKFKGLNINILGIYLQKVNMIALKNGKKSICDQINKSFMLQGYTIDEYELIPMIDEGYNNSDYIQGMKTGKDGLFYKYTKVMSKEEEAKLIDLVKDLIENAAENIKEAKFDIAPKEIEGKNQSCTFCKYNDICFKTYNDVVKLEKKPFKNNEE
jgi:ATP-dependent helicase/DNAse subunit B